MPAKVYFRKLSASRSWAVLREKGRLSSQIAIVSPKSEKDPRIPIIEPLGATEQEIEQIRQEWSRIGMRLWEATLKLLIVCEGETEVLYWKQFLAFLKLQDRVEVRKAKSTNPYVELKLLLTDFLYRKAIGTQTHRSIWLVFDRDSHENFDKLRQEIGKLSDVHVVVSNPCFEYWFLLHYENFKDDLPQKRRLLLDEQQTEDVEGHWVTVNKVQRYEIATDPRECLDALQVYWPGYQKAKGDYLDWLGGCTKLAYERARAKGSPFDGHGSDIPDLIDELCKLAGIEPEDCFDSLFESMSEKSTVLMPQMEHLVNIVNQARNNPNFKINEKTLRRLLKELDQLKEAFNRHFRSKLDLAKTL